MPAPAEFHAVVLAGDRAPDDPVAAHFGVEGKALATVGGRPMLAHVLDTLATIPGLGTVVLVCPQSAAFRQAESGRLDADRMIRLPPAGTPSASAAAALAELPANSEVVLVTADHPLLQSRWIATLRQQAREQHAEFATALVPLRLVQRHYPRSRRTRLAFADDAMCGTNLFVFRTARSRQVAELWQQLEQRRKRPWELVAWLGAGTLLRYLAGRLTLQRTFTLLSQRAGLIIHPVLLEDAEAAIDVDSLDDLRLVEQVLAAARPAHATD